MGEIKFLWRLWIYRVPLEISMALTSRQCRQRQIDDFDARADDLRRWSPTLLRYEKELGDDVERKVHIIASTETTGVE